MGLLADAIALPTDLDDIAKYSDDVARAFTVVNVVGDSADDVVKQSDNVINKIDDVILDSSDDATNIAINNAEIIVKGKRYNCVFYGDIFENAASSTVYRTISEDFLVKHSDFIDEVMEFKNINIDGIGINYVEGFSDLGTSSITSNRIQINAYSDALEVSHFVILHEAEHIRIGQEFLDLEQQALRIFNNGNENTKLIQTIFEELEELQVDLNNLNDVRYGHIYREEIGILVEHIQGQFSSAIGPSSDDILLRLARHKIIFDEIGIEICPEFISYLDSNLLLKEKFDNFVTFLKNSDSILSTAEKIYGEMGI